MSAGNMPYSPTALQGFINNCMTTLDFNHVYKRIFCYCPD